MFVENNFRFRRWLVKMQTSKFDVKSSFFSLQGAISKKKEFEKMATEGKVNPGESTEISNRTNTLSFALMAEINTFHHQRVKDMKTAHQHFLQEQIAFYHKVSKKIPQKNP